MNKVLQKIKMINWIPVIILFVHVITTYLYLLSSDTPNYFTLISSIITIWSFYLCFPKKYRENYTINIYIRFIKYYIIFFIIYLVKNNAIVDRYIYKINLMACVYVIVDIFRAFVYECTRHEFITKLIGELQLLLLDFEYISQNFDDHRVKCDFWHKKRHEKIEFFKQNHKKKLEHKTLDMFYCFLGRKPEESNKKAIIESNNDQREQPLDENVCVENNNNQDKEAKNIEKTVRVIDENFIEKKNDNDEKYDKVDSEQERKALKIDENTENVHDNAKKNILDNSDMITNASVNESDNNDQEFNQMMKNAQINNNKDDDYSTDDVIVSNEDENTSYKQSESTSNFVNMRVLEANVESNNFSRDEFLYDKLIESREAKIPGVITLESLSINYKDQEVIETIYKLIHFYTKTDSNWFYYLTTMVQMKKERESLYNSIIDCEKLFLYFNLLLSALEISFLITVIVLAMKTRIAVVSITVTLFIFTFFPSLKKLSESFLFVINNHPFDCGDRIYWNGENLIVKQITLFHTQFTRWDGSYVIINNMILAKSSIYNAKRSKHQKIQIVFQILSSQNDMMENVERDFGNLVNNSIYKIRSHMFCIDDIVDSVYSNYRLIVTHENNFQNGYYMWKAHNNYILMLKSLFDRYKIMFRCIDLHYVKGKTTNKK